MSSLSRQRDWQNAHLGLDRRAIRITLPASLVSDAEALANAQGVSVPGLVAAALAYAEQHPDEVLSLLPIIERTQGIRFRPPVQAKGRSRD
ncbi:hypothetical protein [Dyella ginsengisoli]|uniref:hypothetical protein n=1 Tax=Dyella ginsengisoli TaxID=363848 RepID=UPI0012FD77D8|nr:hypothetical protein [Dyella ginsengisoli]